MKKKIALSVVLMLLLLLTYGLGYWTGFSRAQSRPRLIVGRDTADNQQSSLKSEYEPYFTQQNRIPDKVK